VHLNSAVYLDSCDYWEYRSVAVEVEYSAVERRVVEGVASSGVNYWIIVVRLTQIDVDIVASRIQSGLAALRVETIVVVVEKYIHRGDWDYFVGWVAEERMKCDVDMVELIEAGGSEDVKK
jgi:hypothetical protein